MYSVRHLYIAAQQEEEEEVEHMALDSALGFEGLGPQTRRTEPDEKALAKLGTDRGILCWAWFSWLD